MKTATMPAVQAAAKAAAGHMQYYRSMMQQGTTATSTKPAKAAPQANSKPQK